MGDRSKSAGESGPFDIRREDQVTQGTEVDARDLHDEEEDIVQEASEDSFPTSDPPAYTGRSRRGGTEPVPPA